MRCFWISIVFGAFLVSCGSGKSDSSGSATSSSVAAVSACTVTNNTISLASGASCEISASVATQYKTTAGVISCKAGTITQNGSQFSGGVTLNGLKLDCAK